MQTTIMPSSTQPHWLLPIIVCLVISTCLIYDVSAFALPTSSSSSDRRTMIRDFASSAASLIILTKQQHPAIAVAPFAPIDALLPATRVKISIDRAVQISSNLVSEENVDAKKDMLNELESILLMPQGYNRGTTPIEVPQRPAKSYLDAYAEYRNGVSLLEKPGAVLVQNGEIDAWKRLKRQEKAREDVDEVRAALNYYTSNLNFNPDRFVLTGTREEKSKLIREDKVPDVKGVIASDMGLRYLLRNDVLTGLDDARAELRYQMKQNVAAAAVDGKDLLDLLLAAQKALNKWFDLIGEEDVRAAFEIVSREK